MGLVRCSNGTVSAAARRLRTKTMAETNYKDAIPTLKDEIDHATVDSVLALDVDKYKYGFTTAIETDRAPMGLSEDTIRYISAKKEEPEWMLEWRLDAYRRSLTSIRRCSRCTKSSACRSRSARSWPASSSPGWPSTR